MFTRDETHDLDAAVMDGATLRAGAVVCVSRIRHPVLAAPAVIQRSVHVLMVASGAEAFAEACGLKMVSPSAFFADVRLQ